MSSTPLLVKQLSNTSHLSAAQPQPRGYTLYITRNNKKTYQITSLVKRILSFLLCVLLCCSGAWAAPTKKKATQHKRLTKNYVNVPLKDVLHDIAKRTDYQLDLSNVELDEAMPVTRRFKDVSAASAIKKILGKQYVVKAKRNTIYITNIPVPPTTYEVRGTTPSAVEEDEEKITYTYQDTTYSVSCRTITQRIDAPVTTPAILPAKHYILAGAGLGYGSMGYALKDAENNKVGSNHGDLQGQIQVEYAYYFHQNWGVYVGLGFSAFGSYGVLNNTNTWTSQGDSDGEQYDHLALTHDWKEQQITHIVDLPIGIQCQYPINDDNLRIYGGLGVRVGVPVYNKLALRSGTLEHQGYYPQWNMLIREGEGNMTGDRDFYTETIGEQWSTDRQSLEQKKISLAVEANIGVMVPMTQQLDLLCGLYCQVGTLNLNPTAQADRNDIGWQQSGNIPSAKHYEDAAMAYRNHTFMNEYNGLLSTNLATATRPWGVGLTVGIAWHHIEKAKTPEPTYTKIQQCDTTFALQPRQEIVQKPKKEAAKQIVQVMRKSVIWFDVNSTDPKLEPADVLDKLAAVLIANPEQQIIISGHASKEGSARKNRILSEQRAGVIADMLVEKGVNRNQLRVEAHSSDIEYTVSEGTTHTIALDRRVEIIPLEDGKPVQEIQILQK